MAEGNDSIDMAQTPYVKVATREIALLVQKVQNAQIENKMLKERCRSLENYSSFTHDLTMPRSPNKVTEHGDTNILFLNQTAPQSFECVTSDSGKRSKTADGNIPVDNDELEVDCDSPCSGPEHRTQDRLDDAAVKSKHTKDSTEDMESQTLLPRSSNRMESTFDIDRIGVSKNYFDIALNELAKSKRTNVELLKLSEKERTISTDMLKLRCKKLEKEKALSQKQLEEFLKCTQNQTTDETVVISMLQRKVLQQARQSELRNLAFDQLNKQCDKWRGKYEEIFDKYDKLAKRISIATYMNEIRSATISKTEEEPITTVSTESTPNFGQLLGEETENNNNMKLTPDQDEVMDSLVIDGDGSVDGNRTIQSNISVIHNRGKDASTQSEALLGTDKCVQTNDVINNNIIYTETGTEEATYLENATTECANLSIDSATQNGILDQQYECMEAENNRLNFTISTNETTSVARELADRMKKLNLQLFSVYRDRDCLQKVVQQSSSNINKATGIYSKDHVSDMRTTLNLGSFGTKYDDAAALSDLLLDCDNRCGKLESINAQYRSWPMVTRFMCSSCVQENVTGYLSLDNHIKQCRH